MTHALITDGYKVGHNSCMHDDIKGLYGNFTNRHSKYSNLPNDDLNGVVFVGLQYVIKDTLIKGWNEDFFSLPKEEAIKNITRILTPYLGFEYDAGHFEDLWELGYLPVRIKAVNEGTIVPYGVAPFTICSTVDGFAWLPLYLETVLSTEIWPMCTSATTAAYYLKNTNKFFTEAGVDLEMSKFMNHDFSMRGCFGKQAAAMSGFSHLSVGNVGTDTLPAILFAEKYYNADPEKELVGCSVKATEHSITTSFIATYAEEHGVDYFTAEVEYARKLLKENPTGILSFVSDSFDFWKFVEEGLPLLKEDILARDGTFVIRPDSGDPVDVLCGKTTISEYNDLDAAIEWEAEKVDIRASSNCGQGYCCHWDDSSLVKVGGKYFKLNYEIETTSQKQDRGDRLYWVEDVNHKSTEEYTVTVEDKGLVETLLDIFEGSTNEKGFKVLNPCIGAIYGDSITLQRQEEIYSKLIAKGIAPTVVLGVGSYSYQYVTRDTHGSAVKATAAFLEGDRVVDVCKDPKTDSKKKSAKGLLRLEYEDGMITQYDQQTIDQESQGLLDVRFCDGELYGEETLEGIRETVKDQLDKLV